MRESKSKYTPKLFHLSPFFHYFRQSEESPRPEEEHAFHSIIRR